MKSILILIILFLPCLLFAQNEQSLKEEVAKLTEANVALNHPVVRRIETGKRGQATGTTWMTRTMEQEKSISLLICENLCNLW